MKNFFAILFCGVLGTTSFAQVAWIEPSPTDAEGYVTVYVDVNQTTGGLKQILINHPDEINNVHFWFWMPADPDAGNGTWNDSNDGMLAYNVSDMIYAITCIPTVFFNVSASEVYAEGISFLAKLDDGNAYAADGVGEAKTEDLHIDIIAANVTELNSYGVVCFPNAADDVLNISFGNSSGTHQVSLVDRAGRTVLHKAIQAQAGNSSRLDISHLTPGIYQVVVRSGKQETVRRIQVK